MIAPTATVHLHELHSPTARGPVNQVRHRVRYGHHGRLGLGPLITGILTQYLPHPLGIPFIVFDALLTFSVAAVLIKP